MIKTLRITSILAILLACAFLAVPFIFHKRSDPKAEEILKSEDAVEKFTKTQSQRDVKKDAQASPLVKQAQAFALFLNPPAPQPTIEEQQAALEIRPVEVAAKFTLVGTSVHPNRPEMSLALIDEPGKGTYWVKQAAQIGHLTIEQIKSGIVVVSDKGRTAEIVAERPEKISLLRNPPPGVAPAVQSAPAMPAETAAPQPGEQPSAPALSPDEAESQMEQISKELAEIEQQVAAGLLDANAAAEKSSAIMEKHMLNAGRITSDEAQGIDQLGAQLKAKQQGDSVKPDIPQPSKKEQLAPKTDTKKQDPSQQKSPRQRSTRKRGTRPRGAPRIIQDSNNPTPP